MCPSNTPHMIALVGPQRLHMRHQAFLNTITLIQKLQHSPTPEVVLEC